MSQTPTVLRLPDTPSFPLAAGVVLPTGHRFAPTAVLSLRLGDMTLTPLGEPGLAAPTGQEGALSCPLAPLLLHGRYSLDVRPERENPLDTGGALAPLSQATPSPGYPWARTLREDVHKAHLATAREERTKLVAASPNGFRLVSSYYQHNEEFHEAFAKDYMNNWDGDGVTAQMADDTDTAVRSDTQAVNRSAPYTDTNGNKVTYNENAFTQHYSLLTALASLKSEADTGDTKKYEQAMDAVKQFRKHVEDDTGNEKKKVTPRTAQQIRDAVRYAKAEGQAAVIGVDDDIYLNPDRYLEQVERDGPDALPPGLDLEDLHHIQRQRAAILAAQAAALVPVGEAYYQGSFQAVIEGATLIWAPSDDGSAGPEWVRADVPQPALELDDSAWQGEAGDIARARIASMRFLTVLLREAITERVAVAARTAHPCFTPPAPAGGDQARDGE
ncbi:hypothetical protein SAMN05216371_8200 [Streptomyces sp. TLI_053]|uniref:hypothetical protein n=1 Tax=Streptomyces sp. TLI_053 TaxID=1855352 RepID=UPI00087CEAFC|nr:hypothetical protein [Streptomyces sp. TLI_053]SDT83377.1 hypothetical protein SAMN05216371_8200 [Streptomyces sp. TLI_053]